MGDDNMLELDNFGETVDSAAVISPLLQLASDSLDSIDLKNNIKERYREDLFF